LALEIDSPNSLAQTDGGYGISSGRFIPSTYRIDVVLSDNSIGQMLLNVKTAWNIDLEDIDSNQLIHYEEALPPVK
jgi:hypothetical protein